MHSFKTYLAEGSTEAAKEMEFVLVDAAGGDSGQNGVYKNLINTVRAAIFGKIAKINVTEVGDP